MHLPHRTFSPILLIVEKEIECRIHPLTDTVSQQELTPKPSLADLRLAEAVRIDHVAGSGPWTDRLRELGFTPGTMVTLLRRAPLGGPLLFSFRGYQLCLRPSEAAQIKVQR